MSEQERAALKAEAERLVREGVARSEAARRLGVPLTTLSQWALAGGWRQKDIDAERAGELASAAQRRVEAARAGAVAASPAVAEAGGPPGEKPWPGDLASADEAVGRAAREKAFKVHELLVERLTVMRLENARARREGREPEIGKALSEMRSVRVEEEERDAMRRQSVEAGQAAAEALKNEGLQGEGLQAPGLQSSCLQSGGLQDQPVEGGMGAEEPHGGAEEADASPAGGEGADRLRAQPA